MNIGIHVEYDTFFAIMHINFDIYKFIPNLSLPILAVLFGPFGLLAHKDS
jgi:hypothetical protein